jgi:hypothetical protein
MLKPEHADRYLTEVPHIEVHSHGFKAKVVKVGDIETVRVHGSYKPFLKPGLHHNNVEQWNGAVTLDDGRTFSVRYSESPIVGQSMFIWTNGIVMPEEIDSDGINPQSELSKAAKEVIRFLETHAGWKFGEIEQHKGSKTHYIVHSPAVDELCQLMPSNMRITIGDVWTDNSPPRPDGKPTIETSNQRIARVLLSMPERILNCEEHVKINMQQVHELRIQLDMLAPNINKLLEIMLKSTKPTNENRVNMFQ